MKLYDVPRGTKVRVLGSDLVVMFFHIDGMYSFCRRDTDGEIVHLAAWTEVEVLT